MNFKSKFLNLINKDYKFDKYTNILIFMLIMVISGIFGFIYETIFYRFDLGYFVKRGASIGPWLPIYAFGGLLISISTYKFRKKPLLVFLISTLVCGSLEFLTGYILFSINGTRLWDYNVEIFNFGNIGGFICLRSVIFFGISSLFLAYFIIPLLKYFACKLTKLQLSIIAIIPFLLFVLDFLINYIIK